MTERPTWDQFFLQMARHYAGRSRDESTKCGAVIVNGARGVVSGGYNGTARGSTADVTKMSREERLQRTAHSETNALYNANFHGISTRGCSIFVVTLDPEYGLPCGGCATAIVNSGIAECVVAHTRFPARWAKDAEIMVEVFREGGVILRRADSTTCLRYMGDLDG